MSLLASSEAFVRNAASLPLVASQAKQSLLSTLSMGQSHSYREELLRPLQAIAPSYVRRAEDFLAARCGQSLPVAELAAHVGVSVRGLHYGI